MFKVFITSILPEFAIEKLSKNKIDIVQNMSDKILSEHQLRDLAKDCDGLITLLSDKITKNIIDKLPKLKIIANCAVGFNNIDYKYAAEKGIWTTNTPDVLTNSTADLAVTLLLTSSRRIIEADRFTRKGNFTGWQIDLFQGKDLYNKNIGIIGFGRIGRAFAKRISGFDTNLFYYDEKRDLVYEKKYGIKYSDLKNLIKNCDYLSLHVPLTPKTKHLINEKMFKIMKDGVVIINTSRGEVIEEKSLIKYLKSGKIFAAGLDVYEFEPKINKELIKLKNVILLPHIGSATFETRKKMVEMVLENVLAVKNGRIPLNIIQRIK